MKSWGKRVHFSDFLHYQREEEVWRKLQRYQAREMESFYWVSIPLFFSFLFKEGETAGMNLPRVSATVQKKRRRKL
jgi:hypothetical protein